MDNECVPLEFFVNLVALLALIVVFVVLEIYPIVPAFKRGFYCNDDTLNKPYQEEETISTSVLIIVTVLLVIFVVVSCECLRKCCLVRSENEATSHRSVVIVGRVKTPAWIWRMLSRIALIIVGLLMTLIIVDIGKKMIGRLRPHFIAVCKPDYPAFNCSDGYITADVCTNLDKEAIAQARLSFPSGHAAASGFVSLVTALYIEYTVKVPSLFKPLVQYVLICIGLAGAMTRIPDYYHHWSDVLVGLLVGFAHALYVVYGLLRLQDERKENTKKVETRSNTDNGNDGNIDMV